MSHNSTPLYGQSSGSSRRIRRKPKKTFPRGQRACRPARSTPCRLGGKGRGGCARGVVMFKLKAKHDATASVSSFPWRSTKKNVPTAPRTGRTNSPPTDPLYASPLQRYPAQSLFSIPSKSRDYRLEGPELPFADLRMDACSLVSAPVLVHAARGSMTPDVLSMVLSKFTEQRSFQVCCFCPDGSSLN